MHGLSGRRTEVDDGEPPVAETYLAGGIDPGSLSIRTAMSDRVCHFFQALPADIGRIGR
jgi:hypothetical protein